MRNIPFYILAVPSILIMTLAATGCTSTSDSNTGVEPTQGDALATSLKASVNQDDERIMAILTGDVTAESTNGLGGISGQGPFNISFTCTGGDSIKFLIDNDPLSVNCDATIQKIDNVQAIALSNGLNIDLAKVSATPGDWAAVVTAAT